jgi:hypothetical protein
VTVLVSTWGSGPLDPGLTPGTPLTQRKINQKRK